MLSSSSHYNGKLLSLNIDCRENVLSGIKKVADAVSVTLGPKGRTVIIDQPYGNARVTKDGVSVAKALTFSDNTLNVGGKIAKEVASKVNDRSGDGTTTATCLLRKVACEGVQAINTGLSGTDLLKGISIAKDVVLKEITKQSKPTLKEDIISVARVSANNDEKIGEMVGDIFGKIGRDGAVDIETGKGTKDIVNIVEGMVLDQGFLSRYFTTDEKNTKVDIRNTDVIVCDYKLSSSQSVVPLLELCLKRKRPLVVISDTIDGDALTTLVLNKLRGLPIAAVRAPGFGETRKGILHDIGIITGATVISNEAGKKIEEVTEKDLGKIGHFVSTKDETIITGGAGSKAEVLARINELKNAKEVSDSSYEKEKLEGRIARLTGGVAVISVGGSSEAEVGERKDRIEDAVCAVKAALAEGIVPGGGVALIRAGSSLDKIRSQNWAEKVGIDIVRKVTEEPTRIIARNAGIDGGIVIQKIKEGTGSFGYDVRKNVYCDLMKVGIVDPTKVVRNAFNEAISVGSLIATSEALITDEPIKKEIN
ncbi:chaperonin CPN602 mitochondrial precursor, putative [Entamoeba histolytica KU27]|uniref:Chaperonin CPN602 mitochondrial, putative n=2 Tax=Entamoeba histolytica TaxID=5759 RepID=M2RXN0_ENTHI|nr:chaperonin CPN602 mitochondrial precursor, putative [Entamoeba histolytica KU27]ENY60395.1 chaperonin CPN60-2, mitochondrial precursor, putative [Entamoeba histolytica HM-1:IMSS-A]